MQYTGNSPCACIFHKTLGLMLYLLLTNLVFAQSVWYCSSTRHLGLLGCSPTIIMIHCVHCMYIRRQCASPPSLLPPIRNLSLPLLPPQSHEVTLECAGSLLMPDNYDSTSGGAQPTNKSVCSYSIVQL